MPVLIPTTRDDGQDMLHARGPRNNVSVGVRKQDRENVPVEFIRVQNPAGLQMVRSSLVCRPIGLEAESRGVTHGFVCPEDVMRPPYDNKTSAVEVSNWSDDVMHLFCCKESMTSNLSVLHTRVPWRAASDYGL